MITEADASARAYQMCTRCVMDTSAPDIRFDWHGVCNYCTEFLERAALILKAAPATRQTRLEAFLANVKEAGRGKPYDCVVGVSGGVDSSWTLVKTVELGLRPLAVHMDNGWNSELAQSNIANLVRGLRLDLYTHVIDWEEYRALMQAFFDADVIDIELLYDNAMLAVNFRQAAKYRLRHILSGENFATEGIRLPEDWVWLKNDATNIRSLGQQSGVRLVTFPTIGTAGYLFNRFVRGIKWLSPLNLIDYKKEEAIATLKRDFGYKPYPYKHYESVFTRFYQGYILPNKFKVDKRRVHLSTLVMSGQLSRPSALHALLQIPYPSVAELESDKEYFLKKMRWTSSQLASYIERPKRSHSDYDTERNIWEFCVRLQKRMAL